MTAIDVDALLQPVPGTQPCGPALEYDTRFTSLQKLSVGVPREVDANGKEIREATEPKWDEVESVALELCAETKDLRIAIYLANAALATQGLPGFRDTLRLIKGYIADYWPSVHPLLDVEDNNDATIRVNTLAALCDPQSVLRALRAAPLAQSRQFGTVSFRHYAIAHGLMPLPPATGGDQKLPDSALIDAAFADTPLTVLDDARAAVTESRTLVTELDADLDRLIGQASGLELEPLQKLLGEIGSVLDRVVSLRPSSAEEEASAPSGGSAVAAAAPVGQIRSRADVVLFLDKICRYYADHEPSSPVPLILERAKRLVPLGFLDILKDVAPDGVDQFGTVAGVKREEGE